MQPPLSTSGLDLSAIGPSPNAPVDAESIKLARLEQAVLVDGRQRDHKRNQTIKDAINIILLVGVIGGAVVTIVLVGVRVAHLALPKESLWLSDAQLAVIDTTLKFIASSAVGGLVFKRLGQALS